MAGPFSSGLNQLRRHLRGLPPAALLSALQTQLETLDVAAIAADNSGRYVAANTKACELTGYSCEELLRLHVRDLTPPLRQDAASQLWNRFIQAGTQSGEYMLLRKDGIPLGVQYSAYASIVPGVHLSLLTPLEVPTSI